MPGERHGLSVEWTYQGVAITARAELGERLLRLSTGSEGANPNQCQIALHRDIALHLARQPIGIRANRESPELDREFSVRFGGHH